MTHLSTVKVIFHSINKCNTFFAQLKQYFTIPNHAKSDSVFPQKLGFITSRTNYIFLWRSKQDKNWSKARRNDCWRCFSVKHLPPFLCNQSTCQSIFLSSNHLLTYVYQHILIIHSNVFPHIWMMYFHHIHLWIFYFAT